MEHGFQLFAQTVLVEDVCLQNGGQRRRFLRRRSLRARHTTVLASELLLLLRAQSLLALAVGLAHHHPLDLSSLVVVVVEIFHHDSWDLKSKALEGTGNSPIRKKGKKRAKEMLGMERGRLRKVSERACTDNGARFEAMLSQTELCDFFVPCRSGERSV